LPGALAVLPEGAGEYDGRTRCETGAGREDRDREALAGGALATGAAGADTGGAGSTFCVAGAAAGVRLFSVSVTAPVPEGLPSWLATAADAGAACCRLEHAPAPAATMPINARVTNARLVAMEILLDMLFSKARTQPRGEKMLKIRGILATFPSELSPSARGVL